MSNVAAELMVKLIVPGFEAVDVPLAVFSVSQLAPGSRVVVQFTGALPVTLTWNEPFGLPGSAPATACSCVPEGFSIIVAFAETRTVTGTVTDPAEVFTRIELR